MGRPGSKQQSFSHVTDVSSRALLWLLDQHHSSQAWLAHLCNNCDSKRGMQPCQVHVVSNGKGPPSSSVVILVIIHHGIPSSIMAIHHHQSSSSIMALHHHQSSSSIMALHHHQLSTSSSSIIAQFLEIFKKASATVASHSALMWWVTLIF